MRGINPFLGLLVKAMHSLMAVNFQFSRSPIYHIMDALTALYDREDLMLKGEIIASLESYTNTEVGGS